MKGSAVLSDDEVYRYLLVRRWEQYPKWVNFVMLNPSTADARKNDPTVRKCLGFAKRWGFTGIMVTNLFAYRARDPKDLKAAKGKRWGIENDDWIVWAHERSHTTVLAWGNQARHYPQRVMKVLELLGSPWGADLYCIGRTLHGQPSHPLMLSYETPLERF